MGKSIKLEVGQFVVTEKSYVVALQIIRIANPIETRLIIRKARATSDAEAIGLVTRCFRRDERDYKEYVIANVAVENIGD